MTGETMNATQSERMELARCATVQIQGLADLLLDLVRTKHVDSHASQHHAALGMLAQISALSDDVFMLVHGDPEDEISRDTVRALMGRLGVNELHA